MGNLKFFIQYPIIDLRDLILSGNELLKMSPDWDNPITNKQFVQYFGHLRRRRRGGHDYFHDEAYFVTGKGSIKLPNLEKAGGNTFSNIKSMYRRLLNDGKGSIRFEIALEFDYLKGGKYPILLTQNQINNIIKLICNIKVQVENLDDQPIETNLLKLGLFVSKLYEKATKAIDYNTRYVINGEPCILMEYSKEKFKLSNNFELLSIEKDDPFQFSSYRLISGNYDVKFFIICPNKNIRNERFRQFRIGILRLYSEHQIFIISLKALLNIKYSFDIEKINTFFNKKTKFLGGNDDIISRFFQPYFDLLTFAEMDSLQKNINSLRTQIRKKIWQHLLNSDLKNKSEKTENIVSKLKHLIIDNNIEDCIKLIEYALKTISDSDADQSLIMIKSSYALYNKLLINGTLSPNEQSMGFNEICCRVTLLGREIDKKVQVNLAESIVNVNTLESNLTPNKIATLAIKIFFMINNKYQIGSDESYKNLINEYKNEGFVIHDISELLPEKDKNYKTIILNNSVLIHMTNFIEDDNYYQSRFVTNTLEKIKIYAVLKFGKNAQARRKSRE